MGRTPFEILVLKEKRSISESVRSTSVITCQRVSAYRLDIRLIPQIICIIVVLKVLDAVDESEKLEPNWVTQYYFHQFSMDDNYRYKRYEWFGICRCNECP